MTVIGEAFVQIRPDTDGFTQRTEQGVLGGIGSVAKKAAVLLGGAFALDKVKDFVTGSISAFGDFEQGVNEVLTLLPGATAEAFDAMSADVLAFSQEAGRVPQEVLPALYQALSAGVPQDNVFDFLETANQAAIGGITDLETAVDGISSVVNAYGDDVLSAAEASDLMFTAVRLGKTDFEQLSSSVFNVAPIASSIGVEFENVTAALARLTAQGTPTRVASTQLRAAFTELAKEGTAVDGVFREVAGKSFPDFIEGGGQLDEALNLLSEHAADTGGSVLDLFGSVEAGQAVLGLTGENAAAFSEALGEMQNSAGATEAAYDQMDQGINRSLDRLKAGFEIFKIRVGEALAPVLEFVLDVVIPGIGTAVDRIRDRFSELADELRPYIEPVLDGVRQIWSVLSEGDFVGGGPFAEDSPFIAGLFTVRDVIVDDVIPKIRELGGWINDNLAPILGGLATFLVPGGPLIVGFTLLYTRSEDFREAVGLLVDRISVLVGWVRDDLMPVLSELGEEVVSNLIDNLSALGEWFMDEGLPAIEDFVVAAVEAFDSFIGFIVDDVYPVVRAFVDDAVGAFEQLREGIASRLDNVVIAFENIVKGIAVVLAPFIASIVIAWRTFGDDLISIIGTAWDFVRSIVEAALELIGGVIDVFLGVLSGDWALAWDGIKSIVDGALQAIVAILDLGWELIKTLTGAAWEAIRDAVRIGIDGVVGWVQGLPGRAVAALSALASYMYNEGKEALSIGSGLLGGLYDAWTAIGDWLGDRADVFVGYIDNAVSRLYGVGQDIIDGLLDGLRDAWGAVSGWLSDRADQISGIFEGVLGIFSPSKVFMGIGENVMEGLNVGLADGFGRVEDTLGDAASRVAGSFDGTSVEARIGGAASAGARGTGGVVFADGSIRIVVPSADEATARLAGTAFADAAARRIAERSLGVTARLADGAEV